MLWAFALCRAIGCPHPSRLQRPPWSLTDRELAHWRHVYNVDPWGPERDDVRAFAAAMVAGGAEAEELPDSNRWPYWLPEPRGPDPRETKAQHRARWGYAPMSK